MDERLRRLQRGAASDPQARLRYAGELIRNGADKVCVDQICEVGNYFNHQIAHGSVAEQYKARNDRQELFSALAACLKPVKIYILLHQSDEGDWNPVGTFTSRIAAIRWASNIVVERLQYGDLAAWNDEDGAEFIDDIIRLYNAEDYDEILSQASNMLGGMDYMVTVSDLFA